MAIVVIQNPNDKAVDVRVVGKGGFLGFGKTDRSLHVGASSSGSVEVPKGSYTVRYRFTGETNVWEGDSFTLDAEAGAEITLQRVSGGNYGVRASGTTL